MTKGQYICWKILGCNKNNQTMTKNINICWKILGSNKNIQTMTKRAIFAEKYWDATPLHSLVAPTRVEFGSAAASQFLSPDPRPVTNLYMVIFTKVFILYLFLTIFSTIDTFCNSSLILLFKIGRNLWKWEEVVILRFR